MKFYAAMRAESLGATTAIFDFVAVRKASRRWASVFDLFDGVLVAAITEV